MAADGTGPEVDQGALGDGLHALLEEGLQLGLEGFDVAAAVFDNFNAIRVVEYGKKNMLYADVLVASFFGFLNGKSKCCAEFLADHDLLSFNGAF